MKPPQGQATRTPLAYRVLGRWMRAIAWVVPRHVRGPWLAEWDGELWYGVARGRKAARSSDVVGLAIGMLRDAAHIRLATPVRRRSTGPGDGPLRSSISDLRYSLRTLRKAPAFTAVVVITLGLGVGATTAIFSVVNALLVNPLPYPDADRLVIMWQGRPASDVDQDWFSPVHFAEIRDKVDAFEALALTYGSSFTMTGRGAASRVGYVMASSSYLRMLGASAAVGRLFDEADDRGDATPVALLTHGLWQESFGGVPDVVGRTVTLGGANIEVVGVLSPDVLLDNEVLPTVGGIGRVDVVLSLRPAEELRLARERVGPRGGEDYNIIGKLKLGATLTRAQAELDVVAADIQRQYEDDPNSGFFIRAVPLLDAVVGGARRPLLVLLASVGVLLLIACVDVANLLLARGTSRRRELGVRAAVGGTRVRLVRALFAESALLAAAGGVLGTGLGAAGIAAVHRFGAGSLPRISEIEVDGRVLAIAIAVTAATCVVFGLLPAWRASRVDPAEALKAGGPGAAGSGALGSRFGLGGTLVIAQIGLSLVLLIGGGLLTRSFVALHKVDPGFQPDGRLTFRVQLSAGAYSEPAERLAFYDRLVERLEALPGVEAAAGVSRLPFAEGISWGFFDIEGRTPLQGEDHGIIAEFRVATPGYFEAMGIPLLRGRGFDEGDRADGGLVALIDERFADKYFPERDPIGTRVSSWSNRLRTIVGVTGTVRHYALERETRVTIYYPLRQMTLSGLYMVVRTTGDPEALAAPAMRVVRELDDQVAVASVASMRSRLAASLAERRFAMVLLQVFGALALILAAVGVYGVVSYRVHRGAREVSLRLALGAPTGSVFTLVLRHGLVLASVGIALGLTAALALTGLLRSMLFGVSAVDPTTFAGVAAVLMATTLIASYVPARRAAISDPSKAIKGE